MKRRTYLRATETIYRTQMDGCDISIAEHLALYHARQTLLAPCTIVALLYRLTPVTSTLHICAYAYQSTFSSSVYHFLSTAVWFLCHHVSTQTVMDEFSRKGLGTKKSLLYFVDYPDQEFFLGNRVFMLVFICNCNLQDGTAHVH